MKILVCPTCGCSLVRLGISKENSVPHSHEGEKFYFCCQGCVDVFVANPEERREETREMIVCPSCLAEKPVQQAVKLEIDGQEVQFCRCPHCVDVFQKNPGFYIKRLEGTIPNEGVLNHEGCCIRPE